MVHGLISFEKFLNASWTASFIRQAFRKLVIMRKCETSVNLKKDKQDESCLEKGIEEGVDKSIKIKI